MFGRGMRKLRSVSLVFGASTLLAIAPVAPWAGAPTWWPDDGSFSSAIGDLQQFVGLLQQSLERLMQWVHLFQQSTSDALTRMVRELPGQLPEEADLTGLIGQINALPAALRGALEAVRSKLQAPASPGSVEERHHAYIESNPAMVHEAIGITETDEVVAGGTVQQAAASQATALGAAAVSRDLRPQVVTAEAQETSDALTSSAQDLPSSRAGIELLVAGMGANLRQQAGLGAATADRLTVLVQQTAQMSQQVGGLAATTGALTLRQTDRDEQALTGQLGLADAVSTIAQVLQEILTGAGDPAVDEPRLDPLY